ncbi:MAG: SurA N-terminal domain-containing protein [Candidatus Omnitrophica bacterium]|nr:SurA N-terminal domain-containing protein [Candidatus Omnitrophota bacterium]
MLKTLRKNTKTIVWTVIVSFSLWGAYSVGTSLRKEGRAVGQVFGQDVSFQEFDFFYRGSQIFSPASSAQSPDDPEVLRQKTWQNIMYSRYAKRKGIQVTDEEVRAEVARLLKAQGLENAPAQNYQRWVESNFRESPRRFEEKVREFMRIHKLLREQIAKPATPPADEELRKQFMLDSATIAFQAIRYPTEAEARAAYQETSGKKNWEKEIEKNKERVINSTAIHLRDAAQAAQISAENVLWLSQLSVGSISKPIFNGREYILFKILEKKDPDEAHFETWKKKYLENIPFQSFMEWSMKLFQEAKIKDYMPRAPSDSPAEEPAPSEGTSQDEKNS